MVKREVCMFGMLLTGIISVFFATSIVSAETLSSSNYQFDESTLGSGGMIQASSPNYQADSVLGDLSIGNSASSSYQVNAGNVTTKDPTLSFAINSSSANFGSFTSTASSTATASFSVQNYTTYGYVVQIAGSPPTNGSKTLPGLTSNSTSSVGTEQFGLNVVANTAPTSVGSNPTQSIFGAGVAAPNYDTPNSYRFVSGETIALAPKDSGLTTYTMTYLINVGNLTPGGIYTANNTLIVTGTY